MNKAEPTMRLLLVDDDRDELVLIRELLAPLVSDCRYELEPAFTLESALKLMGEHRHDAVLLDYRIGASSGLDVLAATAHDPERPPVIVLTGFGSEEIDRRCLAAGAADYLVKTHLDGPALARSLRYSVERHRLSNMLSRREREYRLLFESSPAPMWTFEPATLRIRDANEAALVQYGYTREEFLALKVSDLREPGQVEKFLEHLRGPGTVKGQQSAGVWQHRRKDGSTLDVEVVRGDIDTGEELLRVVLAFDVSARVQAETALRGSESTLRAVLRDLTDGLVVGTRDSRIVFANPAACELLATPEEALIGSSRPDLLIESRPGRGEFTDGAGQVRLVDVRTGDTHWRGEPARTAILHDVTEQLNSARQLALLRRAVASATDGIMVVDALGEDQPLLYVNPAFEQISGYHALAVIGRNCRFLQGKDRDQPAIDEIRNALAAGVGCEVVLRNYRRDGSQFWSRLRISPVRDEQNRLTHFVGIMTDVTAQRLIEAERQYLLSHDALTGLTKFGASEAEAAALITAARDSGDCIVVLFVDLDGFNTINDTMGFAVGDLALARMAERLQLFSGDGHAMRYAGDEFVLLLRTGADANPMALAAQLCDRVSEPLLIEGATLHLTASVGAACFPETSENLLELVRQAEIAAHQAKRGGRNTAFAFNLELRERLEDRHALGSRMREAIHQGEFVLHYQPQIDAQSGRPVGLEALVRWQSPEFGLLPPRRFVPVAEANGLIVPIGTWVLRTACAQLRAWKDQGLDGFVLSVNVSAAQMQRPNFLAELERIVRDSGIEPRMLELELTESLLIDYADRAATQMRALRKLGVRLSLDDFGTGYSSLSYLRDFPLDKLKIDQSFIAGITQQGHDAALVRSIISMGHHLGLQVVAEGVETEEQFLYLRRGHCDQFQGHYFAHAVPADEVASLLRRPCLFPADAAATPEPGAQPTMLVLDDDENIRRSLVRLLRPDGYRILTAATAEEAFTLLAHNDVQVVLSDQRMPGMSGTEFLSHVKLLYPHTVRMVLSGYTDVASVTEAINVGAVFKFLTKPWEDEALRAQVRDAFRRFGASDVD